MNLTELTYYNINELYQMIDTSKELGLTQSYVHLWRWIQDDFTLFDFSNKCQNVKQPKYCCNFSNLGPRWYLASFRWTICPVLRRTSTAWWFVKPCKDWSSTCNIQFVILQQSTKSMVNIISTSHNKSNITIILLFREGWNLVSNKSLKNK